MLLVYKLEEPREYRMKVALALTLIVALASNYLPTKATEEMKMLRRFPGQPISNLMTDQPENIGSLIRLLKKRSSSSPPFYIATHLPEYYLGARAEGFLTRK